MGQVKMCVSPVYSCVLQVYVLGLLFVRTSNKLISHMCQPNSLFFENQTRKNNFSYPLI